MAPRGKYVGKESEYLPDYIREEKERVNKYRYRGINVFSAPTKCPKCKGKLVLVRKHEAYEQLLCKECKRRFRRNVFKSVNEMEEIL